ncbi:MAG: sigma-54 dependent transcriptional regulator [Acidobacteriota bacterium]
MEKIRFSVLLVDDDPAQRQFLRAALERDYRVTAASSGEEARQLLQKQGYDLVLTDERMPGMSGLELLQWVRESTPETPVVLLTAYGSIESAVEAMRLGAADYLTKPVGSPEELRLVVSRCLRQKVLAAEKKVTQAERELEFPSDIVAASPGMRRALHLARQVAPETTTVLITGESGTGKEVVARYIHRLSPRADGPFVAVNCAALAETLLDSELFGHEKGAFTGAVQSRPGRFELAHGGSLFLDEIGEMSLALQAKLLRVLQERRFERVGGTRTLEVDVRVIAATNRDLRTAIADRTFREDLYYRLNVFAIELPPLRERREDIIPLAEHFLAVLGRRMNRPNRRFSEEARARLRAYDWPGNVRELRNAVERALIVASGDRITPEDLPLEGLSEKRSAFEPGRTTLAELERQAILETLRHFGGNRRKTAEALGISLRTLHYRLREYGVSSQAEAPQEG